ncbi:MAG: PDZ domain-containing protein [Candidatus Actinomarinales bacterium]|nr:MAG: PDZ domain-containing protein [Candidatus Actinomarinales bacterium]
MKKYINKLGKKTTVLIIFLVATSPLGLIKSDYYFMSPGPPYQWSIDINGVNTYPFDGNLYQLTVRRDEANYYSFVWAKLDNSVDLYERSMIVPEGVDPEELYQISINNMRTSENVAIAVALKAMGYEITTSGDGVLVVGILDDSPVINKLQKDDLIVMLNDEEVSSVSNFIGRLRTYEIGEVVSISYIRNNQIEKFETQLIQHVEYEGEPMVGFLASTPNEIYEFPFNIDIDTGSVGGPSAGLMMALNVYNLLTSNDITRGEMIAGTGTIEIDGSIGPVGGVKQKVIAAKRVGAQLILVPTSNFNEAVEFSDNNTEIIAVDSFDEALRVIDEFISR